MKTKAVKPIRHKTPYRHTEGTIYCYLQGMRNEWYEDKVHGVWWHRWQELMTVPVFKTVLYTDRKGNVHHRREMMQVKNFVKWRISERPADDVWSMCKVKMVSVNDDGIKRGYSNIPRGEAFGPDTYEYLDPKHVREPVSDYARNERVHRQHQSR